MIVLRDKKNCCGCGACADACSCGAISFVPDAEGFRYPVVNEKLCVSCGRCEQVCPILHVEEHRTKNKDVKSETCAAFARDLSIRFDSTSGGLFSVLAQRVFEHGGFVGGAIWTDDFEIVQVVTDRLTDLPRLRSSKYAQSDARGFYLAVRSAVQSGRMVLVCGTPCQMVAVRAFLGKDYSNLIIVDFICRGINSPLVFHKYVEMWERRFGKKIVGIKQKSKELGWHRLTTKFTFEDGSVAYDPKETSLFMRGYLLTNVFCRPSCYECKFKGFPRIADLTLADCWGAVGKLKDAFNTDLGTSLVICNTEHGKCFFASVMDRVETAPVDEERMLAGNFALTRSLPKPSIPRDAFYARLRDLTFEEAMLPAIRQLESVNGKCSLRVVLGRIRRYGLSMFSLIRINGLRKVLKGDPLLRTKGRVLLERAHDSSLNIEGTTTIGGSLFKSTKLESRIKMMPGSTATLKGGDISYGCDIELFNNAKLEIGSGFYANIGTTIICGLSIKMGEGVTFGRNVTIRDTNGSHYLNSPEYTCMSPVEIGDHVWLCEGCRIMPGVKIGSGSVIAAGAVVTSDVPANTLVGGVPARVIRTGVQWKR